MSFFVQLAVSTVIKWASGLTNDDWEHFAAKVRDAEARFEQAADKRNWVISQIKKLFPKLADWSINLLIELAVAKLRKTQ